MSVKVKNRELERLVMSKSEVFSSRKLSAKMLYWFSRLQRDAENKFKHYAESQIKIYEKYCDRNENGTIKYGENGRYQFANTNTEVASKEIDMMRELETEVGTYDKITIDLNDKSLAEIFSPTDLTILEPFVNIIEPKE